jgi:hypothetical protein
MMKKPNVYIRFLDFVAVLDSKSTLKALDPTENLLLNSIMRDDQAGRSIFVGDLLRLRLLGSQAMLHQRVMNLRSMGYIKLVTQEDARKKRVMPTLQTYKRFEVLSRCMKRAAG